MAEHFFLLMSIDAISYFHCLLVRLSAQGSWQNIHSPSITCILGFKHNFMAAEEDPYAFKDF